jgi:3-hydroxybutyrate dehydrogenase
MTLKTRNAIVTGSSSDIGLAIARAHAKEGGNVMINGMGDAAAIEAERAGMAKIYSDADMTKPDEIHAMAKEADAKLGSVDMLVNNAGVQHVAPIEEFPRDNWNMIIAINLSAAFHAMAAAIPP